MQINIPLVYDNFYNLSIYFQDKDLQKKLNETTYESYVEVTGTVHNRPANQINEVR